MPLSIVTDTASNLPASVVRENNITVIPLTYYIDGVPHCTADADQFNGEEFYGAIRNGALVKTSQIPPQTYIDYLTPILEAGDDILFIGLSSGVSGSFNSARIAADHLSEKYRSARSSSSTPWAHLSAKGFSFSVPSNADVTEWQWTISLSVSSTSAAECIRR